jgi:drug/metabolite transporter (DMT)-like permease
MNSPEPPQFNSKKSGQFYLWFAVFIFGASSAVTRKLNQIGAQHSMNGHNPISLCNVLFVGNLCALLALIVIHGKQWNRVNLRQISKLGWLSLVIVTFLGGAIAPALIFQALALTQVNSVVLVGRLEPPLTLALSIWILRERASRWEILGAIVAFIGVFLTIFLQPSPHMMYLGIARIGVGELFAAIGAIALAISTIISKKQLSQLPLGIYGIFRTALGTLIFFYLALAVYGSRHFMGVFSPFLWQWMLFYGFVIVVLGQSFWIRGLRLSTVAIASLVSSFTPIISAIAAYWILGEVPSQAQYIGGSVIAIGLLLSQVSIHQDSRVRDNHQKLRLSDRMKIEAGMGFKGI